MTIFNLLTLTLCILALLCATISLWRIGELKAQLDFADFRIGSLTGRVRKLEKDSEEEK